MINKLVTRVRITCHLWQPLVSLVVLLMIAACSYVPPSDVSAPTGEVESTTISDGYKPTAVPSLTVPTPEETVSESVDEEESTPAPTPDEWREYINPVYAFTFKYPASWGIEKPADHYINLISSDEKWELTIGVKRPGEDVNIVRTGVAAGDLIAQGTVTLFGQPIERLALIYREKVKAILYDGAGEIEVGNLVFSLGLDNIDPTSSYEEIELPDDIQATVDAIVESFAGDINPQE